MNLDANDLPAEELGGLLRWGVVAASATLVVGGVLFLHAHGVVSKPEFHVFRGEPAVLRSLIGIVRGTALGNPRAIMQLGILLLVATPVARVLLAGFAFIKGKDWLYVGVAATVSGLLFWSLFLG